MSLNYFTKIVPLIQGFNRENGMQGIGKNIPKNHCHHVFVLLWSDTGCTTNMKDAAWKGLPGALEESGWETADGVR